MRTVRWRLPVALIIMIALAVAGVPAALADEAPTGKTSGPFEATLETLSELLVRLEGELSALEAPRAERLEQGIEEIIELIGDLLKDLEASQDEMPNDIGRRVAHLRVMLHRLVSVLESLIEASAPMRRPSAREALNDLRAWVDGYIDGLTAGMDPHMAEQLEAATRDMVQGVVARLTAMADNVRRNAQEPTRLEALTSQLGELMVRMDRLLRRRAAQAADAT